MSEAWQPLHPMIPIEEPLGLTDEETFVRAWKNHLYTVWEYELAAWTHLSIKRNDRMPIHDWRHLQQIKNEVCGEDREAVELYPASHRVMDTANQYHLWVLPTGKHLAVGSWHRIVTSKEIDPAHYADSNAEQRPFDVGLSL